MATAANDIPRFTLPTRIRLKKATAEDLAIRLQLAERIAGLPRTRIADQGGTLPCTVDVYLTAPAKGEHKRVPDLGLCTINGTGIRVRGLRDRDRHQVVMHGWGRLQHDGEVLLFMPRDADELDVCWKILTRAYSRLIEYSQTARPVRIAWRSNLPSFSRTTLQ